MSIEKLQLPATLDQERIDAIKTLLPEAVADGRINFDTLRDLLAEVIEDDDQDAEHFGLTWPGKRDARRLAALPSKGTLAPVPGEGVDEETTENIFIEGENLEVLKILKKSYAGKIKMIYIDPPYNTGQDFIYKDDYSESLDSYLRRTGQADEESNLLVSNSKADGRFHSNWLSMIYPRLKLARELLRDDGVIFVSIDDNEVHNLRQVMNEVFGEENRIECFIWKKSYGGGAKERHAVTQHEYVLLYAKDKENIPELWLPPDPEAEARYYKYKDEKLEQRGPYRLKPLEASKSMDRRQNLIYPLPMPNGKEVWPKRQWWWSKERAYQALANNELVFIENGDEVSVSYKQYLLSEEGVQRGAKPFSVIDGIYTQQGTSDLSSLFDGRPVLQFPKPLALLKKFISMSTSTDECDIILDFFAGSGATAQAVNEANREDDGNRSFILIQLAEKTENEGLPTIAEITKERIRRSVSKLQEADNGSLLQASEQDLGFSVFKLTRSNFRRWQDQEEENIGGLILQAEQKALTPLIDGAKEADVLTEIALLEGFALSAKQTCAEEFTRNKVTCIIDGFNAHRLYVCLDRELWEETVDLVERLPKENVFYCFDNALSDAAKIQLAECCRVVTI